jgi:hypothetical protein
LLPSILLIHETADDCKIFATEGAPPVSTTPAANFATGVVDTGGK